MSRSDDAPGEMTRRLRSRALRDPDVAAVLRGAPAPDVPALDGAATLVAALRALPQEAPAPRGALAALLAEGFDPAAVTPAAGVPDLRSTRAPARGLLIKLAGLSVTAKVLAGTGVAVAGVATASTTGVLPEPVQERVQDVVDAVTPGSTPAAPVLPPAPPVPAPQPPVERDAEPPAGPPETAPSPRATAVPEQATPGGPASRRPVPAEPDRPAAPGEDRGAPAAPGEERPAGSARPAEQGDAAPSGRPDEEPARADSTPADESTRPDVGDVPGDSAAATADVRRR